MREQQTHLSFVASWSSFRSHQSSSCFQFICHAKTLRFALFMCVCGRSHTFKMFGCSKLGSIFLFSLCSRACIKTLYHFETLLWFLIIHFKCCDDTIHAYELTKMHGKFFHIVIIPTDHDDDDEYSIDVWCMRLVSSLSPPISRGKYEKRKMKRRSTDDYIAYPHVNIPYHFMHANMRVWHNDMHWTIANNALWEPGESFYALSAWQRSEKMKSGRLNAWSKRHFICNIHTYVW